MSAPSSSVENLIPISTCWWYLEVGLLGGSLGLGEVVRAPTPHDISGFIRWGKGTGAGMLTLSPCDALCCVMM